MRDAPVPRLWVCPPRESRTLDRVSLKETAELSHHFSKRLRRTEQTVDEVFPGNVMVLHRPSEVGATGNECRRVACNSQRIAQL